MRRIRSFRLSVASNWPACMTHSNKTPKMEAICKNYWNSITPGCSSSRPLIATNSSTRPTPASGADLVQKLLQEQQKQRDARATKGLSIPFLGARFEQVAPLTPAQLDTVFAAVEEHYLRDDLKQRAEKSSSPRDRHLQILRATMQQLRRERVAGLKIASSEMALVNTMIDAIPNPAIKAQLTTAKPTPSHSATIGPGDRSLDFGRMEGSSSKNRPPRLNKSTTPPITGSR